LDVYLKTQQERVALKRVFPAGCNVVIRDVQAHMDQVAEEDRTFSQPVKFTDPFFNDYQSYATIVQKLQDWASEHPDLATFIPSIGKSVEGRDLVVIKLTGNSQSTTKRSIWFNGGVHAREWISPSTTMYLVNQFLSNYNNDSLVTTIMDNFEIHISPLFNPDGYEYSRDTNNGDRYWRKNRRDNGDGTFGVDLNRNWDEHWSVAGASSDTSDETYEGPSPASEPEIQAFVNYVSGLSNRYAGIDFHSYSQLVLRNWGWTKKSSKNEAILKQLGDGMSAAIKSTSKISYTSEKGAALYPASGATDDWMSGRMGMVGYTIELRDTGNYGFTLPKSQIVPTGNEIWSAVKFFCQFVLQNNIPPNQ